ncbi:MAG: hypothetical protein ACFFA6_00725 [Promethearchaeota archaeon]
MNETNNDKKVETETSKKQEEEKPKYKGRVKKTQGQLIQEALGLSPIVIQDVEKKLFMARFLDFFSEETLDFIFNDRTIEQYTNQIGTYMVSLRESKEEEDKLLTQSFESKKIFEIIKRVKTNAEELAISKGIKTSMNKRLRRLTLLISIPMIALIFGLSLIEGILFFLLPVFCLFCMVPQLIKGSIVKKWFQFKDQNKDEVYTKNREDFLILKGFASEILDNVRSKLIELKVPLQLIKFTLFSRDYENLRMISHKNVRGTNQFFYTFDYPPDIEPFPIPQNLQQYETPIFPDKGKAEKREKNFIILADMKGNDGIIMNFIPTLKDDLADKINDMLNECEFNKAPDDFKKIIPGYSQNLAIFCLCGDVANIKNVQICNWKNQFKFYLFEGKECKCGERIYALSIMDESDEIPEELKDIFS